METPGEAMLSDVKVLELSAPQTMLAGSILADLGAEVIALEPPGGAAGRRLAPFAGGEPGLERSLTWHALNRSKRGVTLDVAAPDGREILQALVERADIVIEACDRGSALDGLRRPDDLIVCRATAFSPGGPKAAYRATDAVVVAAGGVPALAGPADRPPLFFPSPQAMMETGAECAVAALAALAARDRLEGGQTAHVSGRIATLPAALGRLVSGRSGNPASRRQSAPPPGPLPAIPGVYECADGHAIVTVAFTPAFVAMTQRIAEWLADEGLLAREVAGLDLLATMRAVMAGEAGAGPIERFRDALIAGCRRKTKRQLTEIAAERRFMAAPVMTMADIAAFEHYHARGLFVPQEVAGRSVEVPARFAQFSDYQIEVRRPAPALSQHTGEVLGELGYSRLEIQALFAQGII